MSHDSIPLKKNISRKDAKKTIQEKESPQRLCALA
jgi:hypothetical protein